MQKKTRKNRFESRAWKDTVKWGAYIHANNSCLYPNERSRLIHAQGLEIAFLTFKSSFDTHCIYPRDLPIKQNGRLIGLRYSSSELAWSSRRLTRFIRIFNLKSERCCGR